MSVDSRSGAARKLFDDCKLSYGDIKDGDLLALILILNKHMRAAGKRPDATLVMKSWTLSRKMPVKHKTNGSITECYLRVNAHYFQGREAISFNRDGFIGFCGWADSTNEGPIVDAFEEWCREMKKVIGNGD